MFSFFLTLSRGVGNAAPKWWIGHVPVDGAEEHAACSRALGVASSKRLLMVYTAEEKSCLDFHLVRVD